MDLTTVLQNISSFPFLFQGEFDLINSSSVARFAFKVKSTAQKGVIRVTPVSGMVEPRQTVKVAVTMLHSTIGYTARGTAATNDWLGHRILVQSMEVLKNCADLDTIWSTMPWRSIKATKLNCVFTLTHGRSTLTASTGAVPRRVAQINSRATTATSGILVGSGAAMTGVTQRRRRKNVTVASQTKMETNPWAPTANIANQNEWEIADNKENAAAGDENAWGDQNAWAEDGDDGNGIQDNVAVICGTENNAASEDAWGTDQNNAATAADDWGNTQNNNNNNDWEANDGDGVQVNDNEWGFENNAAAAVPADDGWAVDNPATVADGAAATYDNGWQTDNNALVDANAWNNGGETAWNNDNYSASAAAAGDYGGQGLNMTFNHGRVIVAFKVWSATLLVSTLSLRVHILRFLCSFLHTFIHLSCFF